MKPRNISFGTWMERLDLIPLKNEGKVACNNCGKLHDKEEDSYLTFYGTVTVGKMEGIIGDNLDNDNKLYRVQCYCRTIKCISDVLHLKETDSDLIR